MIEVKQGQMLVLSYKGYLGQKEFSKNEVTEINDSFVVLGTDPEQMSGVARAAVEKAAMMGVQNYKKVMLKDITGFRRITRGRAIAKGVFTLGAVVGSYFLITELYKSDNLSSGNAFLVSLGAGLGLSILVEVLFPENVRYRLDDGWQMVVSTDRPPQ